MRQIILVIFALVTFQIFGQTNRLVKNFDPIYFKQNSDTIEKIYFNRLDSLGKYLQSDTTLTLQFYSNVKDVENLDTYFDLHLGRAKNILIYMTAKYRIKTNGQLFADKSSSVVASDTVNRTKEKPRLIKYEFIIK